MEELQYFFLFVFCDLDELRFVAVDLQVVIQDLNHKLAVLQLIPGNRTHILFDTVPHENHREQHLSSLKGPLLYQQRFKISQSMGTKRKQHAEVKHKLGS